MSDTCATRVFCDSGRGSEYPPLSDAPSLGRPEKSAPLPGFAISAGEDRRTAATESHRFLLKWVSRVVVRTLL